MSRPSNETANRTKRFFFSNGMKSLATHSVATAFSALALSMLSLGIAHAESCVGLCNPLNFATIADFIAGALKVLVMIALPIVSLFIVISGFLFIKAQGNPSELETAKKNFWYVILGTLLILGAWVIATLIAGTVSQLTAA